MDATDSDFRRLYEQFRAGDAAAGDRLVEKYGGLLREVVRGRLPDGLRREYDSVDFVQEVWAAFCDLPPGRGRFESPEALGGFLSQVARNKVIEVCRRRYRSEGYDLAREVSYRPVAGREATPSQTAIAGERWTALVARLPGAHREVVSLLEAGHTQAEIAGLVGMSERHVRRIVDRLRELCEDDA